MNFYQYSRATSLASMQMKGLMRWIVAALAMIFMESQLHYSESAIVLDMWTPCILGGMAGLYCLYNMFNNRPNLPSMLPISSKREVFYVLLNVLYLLLLLIVLLLCVTFGIGWLLSETDKMPEFAEDFIGGVPYGLVHMVLLYMICMFSMMPFVFIRKRHVWYPAFFVWFGVIYVTNIALLNSTDLATLDGRGVLLRGNLYAAFATMEEPGKMLLLMGILTLLVAIAGVYISWHLHKPKKYEA